MAQTVDTSLRRIQNWMIFLLLGVIAGGLAAAYFLLTQRDMSVLAEGLRPEEASAVVSELDAQGVPYELRDGGAEIRVPADQRDAVRVKLAGADLPVKGLEGFELFDSSDLGLTEFAQRIKYQRAIQGELARTIMKIDGVIEARIHVSIPERSVFRSERSSAKAAVTLLTRSPGVETPAMIEGVQQLVASAITDLTPVDVVVLNSKGAVISVPATAVSIATAAPVTAEEKLRSLLIEIAPDANVGVAIETPPLPLPSAGAGSSGVARTLVRVTTSRQLTAAEQGQAVLAIKADPALGSIDAERITFLTSPLAPIAGSVSQPVKPANVTPQTSPYATTVQRPAAPAGKAEAAPIPLLPILLGVAIAASLTIAVLIVMLRRSGARLSVDDQRRFAERLRLGLKTQAEEQFDAAT